MSIPTDLLCRGVAANFPTPVDPEHIQEAESFVVLVQEVNSRIGLPLIVYRGSSREEDVAFHVFRWDNAPYEEIFQNGFRARRQDGTSEVDYLNLDQWVHHGGRPLDSRRPTPHGFISTTLDVHWNPPRPNPDTTELELYRYEIYAPGGIWVSRTFAEERYLFPAQDEVSFVAGIAPQYIRSAQRFRLTYDANTGFPTQQRVNTELILNRYFDTQSNREIQMPVHYYMEKLDNGEKKRQPLNKWYWPADADLQRKKQQVSIDDSATTTNWYAESYIDAAFRSSRTNEAYLFMKNEYVLLDYAPGTTNDMVVNRPLLICDGFPSLSGTAFGEHGIDCAFRSALENDSAFIFFGNLCALINYTPGTTYDSIKKGPMTIIAMFPFLKGTVFERGVDAAFESTKQSEAYLFKGNQYALINYGPDSHLFGNRLITRGFPSLKSTVFESGIDAAFASHRNNEAYIFKGDSYALINFAPATTDYILGDGVKKTLPDNWPSLGGLPPIDAAFRSSRKNEAYLFMKNEYVLLNYAPGTTDDRVVNGPKLIRTEFPSLKDTAFAEHIDCAFGSALEEDFAFIFYKNTCALINYAPGTTDDWIKKGPMTVIEMFPFLKGTVFESGVDAAFESTKKPEAYLFKGNQYALINYGPDCHLICRCLITQGFPSLTNTIFESGIDVAFASHGDNEAYIFKRDFYALINFASATTDYILGSGVKKILPNWPSLSSILPLENLGLDDHDHSTQADDHDRDRDHDIDF